MGAWAPVRVEGGEMQWDRASHVLTVKSKSTERGDSQGAIASASGTGMRPATVCA